MTHDANYFRLEIDKVKTRAINRAYSPPPRHETQILFRANGDPRGANVDAWATVLLHIEAKHGIPLSISGGGYGCFSFSAETIHLHAERLTRAIETDADLQRFLDDAGATSVEVWTHTDGKSSMETLAPSASYPCIVVTNREPAKPLQPGTTTGFEVFAAREGPELIAASLTLWVYDERTREERPGVRQRIWRLWRRGARVLATAAVEPSDIRIGPLAEMLDAASAAAHGNGGRPRFTVLVHGYATPMLDAVQAFGRLIHNVRYEQIGTVPVIFCWPSRGDVFSYFLDGTRATGSEVPLMRLLEEVTSRRRRATPIVDVLAHSHGTQLTLRSFIGLTPEVDAAAIRNLIFVAPDLHNAFFSDYLPAVERKIERMTVYFSAGDLALWVAGFALTPRVGARPQIAGRVGLDVIDASFLETSFSGHSYHVGCTEMHEDIRGLLDGSPAERRRLLRRDERDDRFWRLLPVH